MKTRIGFIVLIVALLAAAYYAKRRFYDPRHRLAEAEIQVKDISANNELKDGDIIFQASLSAQSKAIQLATHSEYSHCGIIFKKDTTWFVLEAVQPVKTTLLARWIAHGKDEHYLVKRLKDTTLLTPVVLNKMKSIGKSFLGKPYDIYFSWTDERMYCSELIWKIYKRATGLSVGQLEQLKDFDLSNDIVEVKLKERYGDNIPLNDTVISPASIVNSPLLKTVCTN